MTKTGQSFEMNPETFTLQNVFAMELHRFQDTIGDIVNCAVKELAIEKVSVDILVSIFTTNLQLLIYFSLEIIKVSN